MRFLLFSFKSFGPYFFIPLTRTHIHKYYTWISVIYWLHVQNLWFFAKLCTYQKTGTGNFNKNNINCILKVFDNKYRMLIYSYIWIYIVKRGKKIKKYPASYTWPQKEVSITNRVMRWAEWIKPQPTKWVVWSFGFGYFPTIICLLFLRSFLPAASAATTNCGFCWNPLLQSTYLLRSGESLHVIILITITLYQSFC